MSRTLAGSSSLLADHLELTIASEKNEAFSREKLNALGSQFFDADPTQIGYGIDVMNERQRILKDAYPFTVGRQHAHWKNGSVMYLALLSITRTNWFSGVDDETLNNATKQFEFLAEECLKGFFGAGTKTINFGWPSANGRPREFPKAIDWLAEKIGIQPGNSYRPPRRKDGGADIIVWRDFQDKLPGVPIALVQATVQEKILEKSRDIERRTWGNWLALDTDPIVVLAVPGHLKDRQEWDEIAQTSLLLDRIRLVNICGNVRPDAETVCATITEQAIAMHQREMDRYK
jgi:hypothetical protein